MLSGLFSGFMVGTWLQGSVMAVVAGAVGFFVVLRGSSFEAHAIPQGAFTGAAGAALPPRRGCYSKVGPARPT
jgi:zinc/manganese transport system permease protein